MVAQEPVLYSGKMQESYKILALGSVKENILYGCDEEISDNDVLEAARLANVHDFVLEMEKGYETNCGEKGVQMSGTNLCEPLPKFLGGQKQRIAIARALVRKPAVLILGTFLISNSNGHIFNANFDYTPLKWLL